MSARYHSDSQYSMMCHTRTHNKGFALILVLWVLSLLTLMGGSFALGMRREVSITEGIKNNAQAVAIAQSGIAVAEMMMLAAQTDTINGEQDNSWRTDGSIYQINYGRNRVRVRMLAETGKIDINQATSPLLRALLARAPVPPEADKDPQRVARMVSAILDWRDGDDTTRPLGAEKNEYHSAGLKYGPRNKAFQNVEELQMVLGIDAATFTWLEPLITIYSGQAQVDKNATREVLSLLPDVDAGMIQQFLQARRDSAIRGQPLTFPLSSRFINGVDNGSGVTQGGAVSIVSEARLEDGSTATVSALVVKSEIDPTMPFQTLKWHRGYANEVSLFSTAMSELLVAQYNEPQFND